MPLSYPSCAFDNRWGRLVCCNDHDACPWLTAPPSLVSSSLVAAVLLRVPIWTSAEQASDGWIFTICFGMQDLSSESLVRQTDAAQTPRMMEIDSKAAKLLGRILHIDLPRVLRLSQLSHLVAVSRLALISPQNGIVP